MFAGGLQGGNSSVPSEKGGFEEGGREGKSTVKRRDSREERARDSGGQSIKTSGGGTNMLIRGGGGSRGSKQASLNPQWREEIDYLFS